MFLEWKNTLFIDKEFAYEVKLQKAEQDLEWSTKRLDQAYLRQRETDELIKKLQTQLTETWFERNNMNLELKQLREENDQLNTKLSRKKNKATHYRAELEKVNAVISQNKEQMDASAESAAKELE